MDTSILWIMHAEQIIVIIFESTQLHVSIFMLPENYNNKMKICQTMYPMFEKRKKESKNLNASYILWGNHNVPTLQVGISTADSL